MEITETKNECPQCDGTGKEFGVNVCRRCSGSGCVAPSNKTASFMGQPLVKTAQEIPEYSGSFEFVGDPKTEETQDFDYDDERTNRNIKYNEDTEFDGTDNALLIPKNRSDEEIKRGLASMLRSVNPEEFESVFVAFCDILGQNPEEIETSQKSPYLCLDKMNSQQLRSAFCVIKKFV